MSLIRRSFCDRCAKVPSAGRLGCPRVVMAKGASRLYSVNNAGTSLHLRQPAAGTEANHVHALLPASEHSSC